jgi:putative flippase GtrA
MLLEPRRLSLFLLAGGVAAAGNYGSRFVFSLWFSYPAAIVLAYFVGMAIAFALMRQYVFDGRGKAIGPQVLRFTGVNALAVLQTLVVSLVLARWALPAAGAVEHAEAIAHAFGVVVPVLTSYVGHRNATFR